MTGVREWLEGLGLGEYAKAFEAEKVDLEVIPELSEDHLEDLATPLGPRLKILRAASSVWRQRLPAIALASTVLLGALGPAPAEAQEICAGGAAPLARIVSVRGEVEVNGERAILDRHLCPGDSVVVKLRSRAAVRLLELDTVLRLDQRTRLDLPAPEPERSFLELLAGALHIFSETPRRFEVRTPFVDGGVEGTEFQLRVELDESFGPVGTTIRVFDGTVRARNRLGEALIASAEEAFVPGRCPAGPESCVAAEPPRAGRITVDFEDAVAWAIYYPPIVPDPDDPSVPERLRRAAALLAAGRFDDVERLLAEAPADAATLAVRSIAALARNRRAEALALAERAVAAEGERAVRTAALIALSYARQARFDLEAAHDAAIAAAEGDPDNALAHARLAELDLALGERRRALEAARRAADLAPGLARTHLVLGFAALAAIDTEAARTSFAEAIARDPDDPLAFLGLGLAVIRSGRLAEGRAHIETAALIDPANALVRSYLGKAYFEEKRGPLDADQFAIAKGLDPADPTPWFYEALRKQTENRPVEALADLQESIELNDNRAVYRSRLMLDQDRAVRGTSLGRIYDDLGFDQLALVEGARSLSVDPSNHSAHRFLSDTYATLPRHEIARASELLQAQLLQPINISPVQPRSTEIDLNILARAGPANPAFNEFTPVFQRDGHQLVVSGVVGDNSTWGDEAVLSGIIGRMAYSIGQFHHQTDGFRVNNDLEHDIYNIYAQAQLLEELDIQFEYRHRESEDGDLNLNFDPENFSTFDRRRIDKDTLRVGIHFAPEPGHDFLVSAIYRDRTEELDSNLGAPVFEPLLDLDLDTQGTDIQAQYLFNSELLKVAAGAGISDVDSHLREAFDLTPLFPPIVCLLFVECVTTEITDFKTEQHNAYLYGTLAWPESMVWTLGISYDSFDEQPVDVRRVNPKVGLQWSITDGVGLRLAYINTVKRSLLANQTLEPTQVAGFNQFFDDINGSKTERIGVGLDFRLNSQLYAGLEFSRRDLEVPFILALENRAVFLAQDEELYLGYIYWTPHPRWSVSAKVQFEGLEPDQLRDVLAPIELDTLTVPLTVRYFDPGRFFAQLGATYVQQKIEFPAFVTFPEDEDHFVVVDAAVGYRFPKRWGLLSLEVRNLFDQEFLFQDRNFVNNESNTPQFIPERTILLRVTINL